jgi:predicted nuclease with TOPRIM domain
MTAYIKWFQMYASGNDKEVAEELTRLQTELAARDAEVARLQAENSRLMNEVNSMLYTGEMTEIIAAALAQPKEPT